jgi:hypothetical protein
MLTALLMLKLNLKKDMLTIDRNCDCHVRLIVGVLLKGQWANTLIFFRGVTLTELLSLIEEDDGEVDTSPANIAILLPVNACDVLTDEDSGEEDNINVNNLPASQLRAEVEIFYIND